MSFSSEIKEEILEKFNKYSKKDCCKTAERFGEYLTVVHNKQDIYDKYKDLFEISNLNECCIKSIIKGAFLSSGCITDPNTNYHFEISFKNKACGEYLVKLLSVLDLTPKLIKRQKLSQYVIYIKDSEQISILLSIMDVAGSLLHFENVRVEKEVKNNINRSINCETANLSKTIEASVKQIEAIKKIKKHRKFDTLNNRLKVVAVLREKYPNESIDFLAKKLSETEEISKSGVKHRLDKIIKIANEL